MKELVAFLLLIVLIGFGWNQSYEQHFRSLTGGPPPEPPPPAPAVPGVPPPRPGAAPIPAPAATPAGKFSFLENKALEDAKGEAAKPGGDKSAR